MGPELEPVSSAPDAGFTLIELLISVAVLAVLAVGAALALPRSGGGGASDLALFRSQFATARSLAITGQQSRGLRIDPQGLTAAFRGDGGWQNADRTLRWRGRVAYQPRSLQAAVASNRGAGDPPGLVVLATGQTTAFDITFGSGGSSRRCQSDGWTGLTCDAG